MHIRYVEAPNYKAAAVRSIYTKPSILSWTLMTRTAPISKTAITKGEMMAKGCSVCDSYCSDLGGVDDS